MDLKISIKRILFRLFWVESKEVSFKSGVKKKDMYVLCVTVEV